MIKKQILLFIFFSGLLHADVLFTENFDENAVWPTNWTFDEYIDPETGEVLTTSSGLHNWRVARTFQDPDSGFTPPAALFYYYPRIPRPLLANGQSAVDTWYELSLQSPDIDVGDNSAVMVEFTIALDYWTEPTAHINGMVIEADGGSGWSEMLKYEVGGLGAGNNFDTSLRTESFVVDIQSGVLKIRWRAYGTDSYYLDAWIIDNIKVITLPKLSYVHIESNNETDNQTAIEGNDVTLSFTSEQTLLPNTYVQINGSEADVIPQGSNSYNTTYTVTDEDADGPITFSIDFTAQDGFIDGSTVKTSTDNSRVTIDRTPPPPFDVAETVSTLGGNIFAGKWNSTNTGLELEVSVPEDSAVIDFIYFQGNSISFDGTDDRVTVTGNSIHQFSNQMTVEVWIKPNSTNQDNYRGIISFGQDGGSQYGFGYAFYATGWRFFLVTPSNSVDQWTSLPYASAPAGQWTHLAATYDGSKLILYKNGSLAEEKEISGNIVWPSSPGNLQIGSFNKDNTDYYFSGQIDEVRLWNIVRTGPQIKGNKSINLEGNESGLVSYWKADESSGTTLNDETSNQIDGTLNGATFATLNSPINFSTPVYDNTVIIGSNYQLRTKIGSNDFQAFDNLQEITNDDFYATTKTISGTASTFTSVSGYQHNETALLSALLYDQSGNFSMGDTSNMSLEIDLIANNPTSSSIASNNTNSSYAKIGDIVTITMSYDEDIGSTTTTIENNSATDTDLGSEQFKAEYTLAGTEPEGVIDFTIDALDYMGNPGSYSLTTDGSQVTFDKTPPELTYVNISSNNADTAWAKVSDSISIAFTSSEAISLPSGSYLSFDGVNDRVITPVDADLDAMPSTTWSGWIKPNGVSGWQVIFGMEDGGWDRFLIIENGGLGLSMGMTNGRWQTGISVTAGAWQHVVAIYDNGAMRFYYNGEEHTTASNEGSHSSSGTFTIGGNNNGNQNLYGGEIDEVAVWNEALTASEITDIYNSGNRLNVSSNSGNYSSSSNLVGYWRFNDGFGEVASDLSGNGNDGTLTNMDGVNSWVNDDSNSESLIPSVSILGQAASVSDLQNNKFTAVYVPTDSDTEGEAAFEIQFSDLAGNTGTPVTSSTNNTKVIFDKTDPADFTVGLLTPTGGNQAAGIWNLTNTGMEIIVPVANDTTLKNGTVQLYAKIGSNIFAPLGDISTILSSEINTDKTISITGDLIEGLTGFAEGQTIYIKATMIDRPGNSKVGLQSATEILIDETPASITPVSIISNNDNTTLAKVGDTVTVSFTTSEILIDTTVSISGQSATITGLGSNQFKAEYEMAEEDSEGVIEFEISFIDIQGNPLTGTNATTDASQVTFDKTKPTLDPVTILSDNSCSAGSIAKEDNIITINFTSLEPLLSTFSIVMGDTVSVTDLGSSQYKIDHQLTDTDEEGNVSFLIRVTDLTGNISEDIITTTDNSNVEFDITKPLLTNVHIESNNNYSSIAVLGDIATLTFEASEPLSNTTVQISSSAVTATESNGVYSASYTIQSSDIAVGGFLSFAIDFVDCPGNVGITDSTTTDESFVSIDIGPPEMVSVKIFSSNQDSSWAKVDDSVFVYFVVNEPLKLDGNPTSSLTISGNTVDITNVQSTSYQGHYVMTSSETEGEVSLEISFYDLGSQAGNGGTPIQATTDNTKVIFDKTNPGITSATFTTNNIYSNSFAKVDDIGTITISLDENIRGISTQLDNYEIDLNGSGQDYSYSYTFSDTNNNGVIMLNMLVSDSAGNQHDTLIDRVYFDKISPSAFNFYEGSSVSDKAYTKYADSLQLAWSIIESGSGNRFAYIALGSDSGLVDIVNWTLASEVTQSSFTSINLSNNSKYFGAVWVEDSVGNKSDSIWGNGITVDLSPPVPGTVWDGFLDEDIDYTADSTLLFVRWSDFTDNQSIDYYEASIGSADDTTSFSSWQKSNELDNIEITGLNLERNEKYFAYLRATDSAANVSSAIRSDGIEFDNTPPGIKSIYPFFDSLEVLSVTDYDNIQISFNKPILKFGLNVSVTQDSIVNYDFIKQDSGFTISILDILPSYETITLALDTAIAFNLLNYTDTIIFRSKLWGDLNNDYKISIEDVLAFNQSWPHSSTDLGPVSGVPPFLVPAPDGELNLNDLAAFGKMWIWYYHEYSADSLSSLYLSHNSGLNGTVTKNKINIAIPDNVYGAEIVFFHSNQSLSNLVINNLNAGAFNYFLSDSIHNSISFIVADKNGLDSTLSFSVPQNFPEGFMSNVKYKFIDANTAEVGSGAGKLNLTILPHKFDIYQNYPNPFNAETIVRYDLPKSEDVSIKIYDIMGREIFSEFYKKQSPGENSFIWKGNSNMDVLVSSGMYFLQMSVGKEVKRMKMILLK